MSAELLQVCWLEVTTCATTIKSGKKYQFGFSVSLTSDAFGWSSCPVYVMAKIGRKGKYTWKKVDLLGAAGRDKKEPFEIPDSFVLEIPSDVSPSEKELHFGLYEVWSGKWKGGLKIHHAFVREQ
uniref:Protein PHLOEM PROTEIN 2-LIKE A9-like n=1 Tax=Davidia involucrata TaxID=16924 RepID=A0A5B6YS17_DAVIN